MHVWFGLEVWVDGYSTMTDPDAATSSASHWCSLLPSRRVPLWPRHVSRHHRASPPSLLLYPILDGRRILVKLGRFVDCHTTSRRGRRRARDRSSHYSGGLRKPFRHSSLEKMVGHLFLLHDLGSLIFPGLPLMWMHDSLSYEWTLLDAG